MGEKTLGYKQGLTGIQTIAHKIFVVVFYEVCNLMHFSLLSRILDKWICKPRSFLLRMFDSIQNGHMLAKVSDCLRNASAIASFPLRMITRLKTHVNRRR